MLKRLRSLWKSILQFLVNQWRLFGNLVKKLPWQVIWSLLIAYLALVIFAQIAIGLNGGTWCKSWECRYQSVRSVISLDNIEAYAIFFAASLYLFSASDRRKKRQYEAWEIVNAADDGLTSGGRIAALQDLSDEDVNLSGLSLERVYLTGINLATAKLSGACFLGADLRESVFDGAILNEANFEQAQLFKASFVGAKLEKSKFNRAKSFKGNFLKADANESSFKKANMDGAIFQEASLIGANFTESSLWRADFTDANLSKARFIGANLYKAKFNLSKGHLSLKKEYSLRVFRLEIPIFESMYHSLRKRGIISSEDTTDKYVVKLHKSYLPISGQNLEYAKFMGANLMEVELIGADLSGVKFPHACLEKAKLQHSNLTGARLFKTNCREANFQGADCSESFLIDSNFVEAIFDGANFELADLRDSWIHGASFYGAKNVSVEQIKLAIGWEDAKFDPLFKTVLSLDSLAVFLSSRLNRWLS